MSSPIKITEENHQLVKDAAVSIVDFSATWCGPCKKYDPIFEELAGEYDGQAVVAKVDIGAQPSIAQDYSVMSVPTIILFKAGELVDRIVGVVPKAKLAEKLDALLA